MKSTWLTPRDRVRLVRIAWNHSRDTDEWEEFRHVLLYTLNPLARGYWPTR